MIGVSNVTLSHALRIEVVKALHAIFDARREQEVVNPAVQDTTHEHWVGTVMWQHIPFNKDRVEEGLSSGLTWTVCMVLVLLGDGSM